jgi:hypothetical protein
MSATSPSSVGQSVERWRGRLCAETLTEVVESSIEAVRCEQLKHAMDFIVGLSV